MLYKKLLHWSFLDLTKNVIIGLLIKKKIDVAVLDSTCFGTDVSGVVVDYGQNNGQKTATYDFLLDQHKVFYFFVIQTFLDAAIMSNSRKILKEFDSLKNKKIKMTWYYKQFLISKERNK